MYNRFIVETVINFGLFCGEFKMLSLEEKIGQMLMVGFEGLTAPDYILDWLRQGRIGGVILFA